MKDNKKNFFVYWKLKIHKSKIQNRFRKSNCFL
jgi:hypothetical protein